MKFSKIILVILVAALFYSCGTAPKVEKAEPNSRQVTYIEEINSDTKVLAWGIGNDNVEAEEDALKAALYCYIMTGIPNCKGGMPLLDSPNRIKKENELNSFFKDKNKWINYVSNSNQGRIDPDKRLKIANGQVKLGVEVLIRSQLIYNDFVNQGIYERSKFGR